MYSWAMHFITKHSYNSKKILMDHGTHLYEILKIWFPFGLKKMNLSKVFKDFRNYFSLCQVFDELLEWFSRKYQWLLHYSLRVLDCYWEIPTDTGKAKSCGCQILWGRKKSFAMWDAFNMKWLWKSKKRMYCFTDN